MSNESGLKPLGRCLLVQPMELEIAQGAIKLLDSTIADAHMLQMRVRVVEVGPACWPDEPARCKQGDVIMVAKMSGVLVMGPKDSKQYRAINDRDAFIQVTYSGD